MKALTTKQKSQIESRLLRQRAEYEALEKRSSFSSDKRFRPNAERRNNLDERKSDAVLSRELHLENHYLKELQQIERALEKLDSSQFGLCLDCRNPIAYKRLFAFPMAERCTDCKSFHEEKVT